MEFAYKKFSGEIVSANDASEKGLIYICPYCGEENLSLRKGKKINCFAHPKKIDRTPLEKTCPEYKKSDSIKDEAEKLYIKNGGVPIYLHKNGDEFYIDAIFPQLSEQSLNILKNAKLKVGEKIYNITDRAGIINYRLNDVKTEWINVSITDNRPINPEIKQKWLLGIMGLNKIEKSIFQCNINGGYRISHNSHIYVGQKYYIITPNQIIPDVFGIEFDLQGEILLSDSIYRNSINYYIYTMRILSATAQAKNEIQKRQYILCEKISSSYPVWPPCHILGNQLVYNTEKAFFFEETSGSEHFSYHIDSETMGRIDSKNNCFIIYPEYWRCIYKSYDVSNTINGNKIPIPIENIQWYITYQNDDKIDYSETSSFELANDKNEIISEGEIEWENVCDFKILSNIPVKAILKKGEFVIGCYQNKIENIMLGMTIILDAVSYGQKRYYIVQSRKDVKTDYSVLLNMRGISVKTDSVVKDFYARIKKSYPSIARQLKKWILSGSIPVVAKKYIYDEMRK